MVKMSDILFAYCGDFTPGVKIFTSINRKPWIQNENRRPSENNFSKKYKINSHHHSNILFQYWRGFNSKPSINLQLLQW